MEKKHLHELLNEEQEPFILKNYINERRCKLKTPISSKPQLHLKTKPISKNPTFSPTNFCFFHFRDSNVKKSPPFDFPSPVKSPIRNPNTLFLNIPSRTMALLLEAALRIQNQSSSKPKNNTKSLGFGLFGSFLKRMARKRTRKPEICVKDILRWDSFDGLMKFREERVEKGQKMEEFLEGEKVSEMGFSCSCNSSFWPESYQEKSLDLESSSSRSEEDFEERVFVVNEETVDFESFEKGFCLTPFRFLNLQSSPDSGSRTPEFPSSASSPGRRKTEVIEDSQLLSRKSTSSDDGSFSRYGEECKKEKEEEKDQFSPVSVLDAPFEDDEGHDEEEETFQDTFATVQRAKHLLLNRLRRFERLANLDPIELEKIYAEEEEEEEEDYDNDSDDIDYEDDENEDEVESLPLENEEVEEIVRDILNQSISCSNLRRIPTSMKRLVADLIEDEKVEGSEGMEAMTKVCKRIKSWKDVKSNTMNTMVGMDLRREGDSWSRYHKEVQEIGVQIELAIFGFLVEELYVDLF
ncbi:uncharacterized protein LOC143877595 isoform X2 [Tasmannia lanceolata]|uniref:uncharacterized protein LOC143877595 isoform X2 n=1 Tax=Tasmannia lanceolata TaxID=3420 RepID=UPI0040643B2F